MTKKEYEKIFNLEHKKDYGPRWLKGPAIFGIVVLVGMFLYCMDERGRTIYSCWREVKSAGAVWSLIYIFSLVCLVIEVIFSIKRWIDLDAEYKVNMGIQKNQPNDELKISIADEIEKYKRLYEEGVITKEEFCNKKDELLKRN